MADLFALLVQSGAGLAAHSGAISAAGHNIANANTPGFSRQIANLVANPALASSGPWAVGSGVTLASVTQARDQFIERQMPNALAAQARSQSESYALGSVAALNPDIEGGVGSALGAFYASLRTLSQNPGDMALRQAAIASSQALARSFNETFRSIEEARTGLDAKLDGDLNEVNMAARSLLDLNRQIQIAGASGSQSNDLLDKRQMAIDTLARLTGATPYTNADGAISMALPGGLALVTATGAGQLSAVPDAANNGHLKLRITKSDGTGPLDLSAAGVGGELGGLLAARDGAMRTAETGLDNFAFDLATAVNTVHQAGFAMDGSPGLVLFTIPVAATGAASQITVNPLVAADARLFAAATTVPAATGDNRNVLALLATERQALAGGKDPVASFQQIVTGFGASSAQAQALAEHDQSMATHLQTMRDATSGVSLDEEMINLTKAQKAYEALAKVIATADQMLDTLMSLR